MKNPFRSGKSRMKIHIDDEVEGLMRSTDKIEEEKERKRLEREEKKFLKEQAKKRQQMERLIAPFLLILTILISYIILTVWQH